MLSKRKKLLLREKKNFFIQAKKIRLDFLHFFYLKDGQGQFIVIVPKKIVKQAVKRNKIKRIFYFYINSFLKENKCNGSGVFILKRVIKKDKIKDQVYKLLYQIC